MSGKDRKTGMSSDGYAPLPGTARRSARSSLHIGRWIILSFTTLLRTTLNSAGIDSFKFASHSFCSGAATTAADIGMAVVHIKMLGQWASEAYQVYIKTPPAKLAKLTKQLTDTI